MLSPGEASLVEKYRHMLHLCRTRKALYAEPQLRYLFFELTLHCNEHCRHCGSSCGDVREFGAMSAEEWKRVIDEVAEDFAGNLPMLCITGGEPLLYKDLFDIMAYAKAKGFSWGMTSNGLLITPQVAHRLAECGMRTISVSLDGLEADHEWFRQAPGSYQVTLDAIRALVAEGSFSHVQVTTVVNRRNYETLEELYNVVCGLGVKSWRVINVDPIGRAKLDPDLLLSPEQLRGMLDFITAKRAAGGMEVCYGCSHYLGVQREGETRNWYFQCTAGTMTASIMYNGDVVSCLDLPRRPELVEGNVRERRFADIWREGFRIYRGEFRRTGKCKRCAEWKYCGGDSFHCWDFDAMEPGMCLKGIVF